MRAYFVNGLVILTITLFHSFVFGALLSDVSVQAKSRDLSPMIAALQQKAPKFHYADPFVGFRVEAHYLETQPSKDWLPENLRNTADFFAVLPSEINEENVETVAYLEFATGKYTFAQAVRKGHEIYFSYPGSQQNLTLSYSRTLGTTALRKGIDELVSRIRLGCKETVAYLAPKARVR